MPWSVRKKDNEYCVYKEGTDEVEGCHATRDEAIEHMRALYASEEDVENAVAEPDAEDSEEEDEDSDASEEGDDEEKEEDVKATLQKIIEILSPAALAEDSPVDVPEESIAAEYRPEEYAWEGEIVFEEQLTGDRRIFKQGSISWAEDTLPWPFRWQRAAIGGHDGAVTIGRVDRLERRENAIYAHGVILAVNPEAWEYLELLKADAAGGVSVDGDDAQLEIVEDGEDARMEFSSMRLRSLTAVDIPAFNNARIKLSDPTTLTAAAVGDLSIPMADRNERWDGYANQKALFAWAKTEHGVDPAKMKRAFLWQDSDGDPTKKGSYKLPFVKLSGGSLVAVPKAVFAAAAALEGARGGVKIPDADKVAIRKKVATLYGRIGGEPKAVPPWDDPKGDAAIIQEDVITAAAIPVKPPAEWFVDPELDEPTPLTVTPDGAVFGHIALFDTCHIGFPGSCVRPPKNATYNYFHTGEIEASEGECVTVGHLTFNTGHADLAASPAQAASHYDHTGTVAADVRAGEDKFGVWVAGALRPSLSDEDIRVFRAAPISGDWRRIAGRLELVAALSVNTPGFPVPRTRVLVASGEPGAMITGPVNVEDARTAARKSIKSRIANSLMKQDLAKRLGGK